MNSSKQKISGKSISKKKDSEMKTYSLNEMIDDFVGKKGTRERQRFDYKLEMDLLGSMIKSARKKRKLGIKCHRYVVSIAFKCVKV